MATKLVTLVDGYKVGEITHTEAELRLPTAGDIIDASIESERVVPTPEGYQLLVSASMVGLNVLRRQVARIGTHQGPLALGELRRLSQTDLAALQIAAQELDAGLSRGIESRGRAVPPGGGADGA